MEKESPQNFDAYLGGDQILPSSVNIGEFCKGRVEEILMLTEALKESPFRGQAFQRLPKHMRRRQMSHHIKRLPRRLRNMSFLASKDEPLPPPSQKCPSRKYRRRPQNLLSEYNRRQREHVWLETHIWHARRFHMTSKWGYKLPEKPTNKSFRACYRAATQHCLLTDISYYNCLELTGLESRLLDGLQTCVSPKCGLTFAAKMFITGAREGSVTLHHPNSFPYGAIGQVSFIWKPAAEKEKERTLWIFAHPLHYSEITDMLKTVFDLKESKVIEVTSTPEPVAADVEKEEKEEKLKKSSKKKKKVKGCKSNKETLKLGARNVLLRKTVAYTDCDGSVTMCLLKDVINRFRLTGPLSLAVISQAFDVHVPLVPSCRDKPGTSKGEVGKTSSKRSFSESFSSESSESVKKKKTSEGVSDVHEEFSSVSDGKCNVWWEKFFKSEDQLRCLQSQADFYKRIQLLANPTDLPPRMVFSIVVRDPRLTLPTKRVKCTSTCQGAQIENVEPSLTLSPLWEADVREEVARKKISTAEINQARSKLIVPGSDVGVVLGEEKQSRVPLIVIQRPGVGSSSDRKDLGSGFDIILPSGWAMPVWLSLIYRGARTGGLRESELLLLETKNLEELLQPDSAAGESENLDEYRVLREKYFRKPPNKRPNYSRLGVVSPFYLPWKKLVSEWRAQPGDEERFHVLRDRQKLAEIAALLRNLWRPPKSRSKFEHSFAEEEMDCLVEVAVESSGKGSPKKFAMLCAPTGQDFLSYQKEKASPKEGQHWDRHRWNRTVLREEHVMEIKYYRRKKRKMKMWEDPPLRKKMKEQLLKEEREECVEKYAKEMENLTLEHPDKVTSFTDVTSRRVMGYVVLGGFCFSKASGLGLGYVALRGLLDFLKLCHEEGHQPMILFRNSHTVQYRFARLTVVEK